MKNLKVKKVFVPFALAGTLVVTSLTGCGKKMDCDIEDEHMHKYVSEEGFETYKEGEYEENSGMMWTEETVTPNKQLETISDFDLIRIDENIDALEVATKNDLPYIEYEYVYTYLTPIRVGKITTMVSHTAHDFTTDKEDDRLTGYIRDVNYKYQGYKIGEDKKGESVIIESDLVDDLTDIMDEYPYFKLSDYKQKVYSEKREMEKELTK